MAQIERLLQERGATQPSQRKAHFVSALCVAWPDDHLEEVEARVDGTLVWPPRGIAGFGYDPAFLPDGHSANVRRDDQHREAWPAAAGPRPVASRPRLCETGGDLPVTERRTKMRFGVYVHWPFCLSKCPYCDFNSHVRHAPIDEDRFASAFAREIETTAARAPGREVSSIFLGGGTPSLMKPQTVGAILDAIGKHWRVADDAEVTLEANPTSVEATRFAGYRAAGVNQRLARRAGAGRCFAEGAGTPAYRARSARRGQDRAHRFRALFVRPDLCAARSDPADVGRRIEARHLGSRRASVALSAHHRRGHAVLRPACRGQTEDAGRDVGAGIV